MYETYDGYQNHIEKENEKYYQDKLEEEWKSEQADLYNDFEKCMANFDETKQND